VSGRADTAGSPRSLASGGVASGVGVGVGLSLIRLRISRGCGLEHLLCRTLGVLDQCDATRSRWLARKVAPRLRGYPLPLQVLRGHRSCCREKASMIRVAVVALLAALSALSTLVDPTREVKTTKGRWR
jgi:hypothetical protein